MGFDFSRAVAEQGKALGPFPAFMDRSVPVSTYSPGTAREDAVVSQRTARRHMEAYGGKEAIDWVYDCIGLFADAAATAEYHLEKPDGTKLVRTKSKGTPPDYEVGPAALYSLLDQPNPYQLYSEVMDLLVIDLLMVGNAYWYKHNWGTPAASLYRLAPSYVQIKPDKYGPKKYHYQPPGSPKAVYDREKIVHFRRPNPHDGYYGMGVIQGAGKSMDLELALTSTMSKYYENRADPSLIIESERRVPNDIMSKLRLQLRRRVTGDNYGDMLVLQNGLKASTLSRSAADSLFDVLSRMSRDRVFTKFRASPMLFGILDQNAGGNKVSDFRREFDNSTLRPFLARLSEQITIAITSSFDVHYVIDHRSTLPADEAIKVGESVAKLPGIKIREARRMYAQFGIDESTGDPDIDELIINLPGENMDATGQGVNGGNGLADQPLGTEAGRPPKIENTAAIGSGAPGGAVASGKSMEQVLKELEAKAMNAAGERVTVGNKLPDEQAPSDAFLSARTADINSAAKLMENAIQDAVHDLERGLLDHVEGKALRTTDLVGRIRNSPAWTIFRRRLTEILEDGASRAASSGVMFSGLTPDEEIDYEALARGVVNRPEGIRAIMKTVRDRVVNSVKDARAADAERTDYENVIRDTLNNWSQNQAPMIADSEAVEAYNEATLTAGELSGVSNWYVVEEADAPDEACQEARGSVWDTKTARGNRKEHPRCRRSFLPLADTAVS